MLDAMFMHEGHVEDFQEFIGNKHCLSAEAVGCLKI